MIGNIVLLHISDLHIEIEDSKNRGAKTNIEKLAKFIDEKEKTTTDRFLILITGDIGDNAKADELNKFLQILEANHIDDRIIFVPGNHDACHLGNEIGATTFDENAVKHYQLLQACLLNRCRQFITTAIDNQAQIDIRSITCDPFIKGKFLFWNKTSKVKCTARIFEYTNRKIIFVLVDSNPQNVMFSINFAQGEIGKKQIKAIKDIGTNSKYNGWLKAVLLHHHPIYNNYFLKLKDSAEFLQAIWDTFSIVCFGHKHAANCWSSHAGNMSAAPAFFESGLVYRYTISPNNTIGFDYFQV